MGQTCGCGEKEDPNGEISTDPKKLGQALGKEDKAIYRDSKVMAGQTDKLYGNQQVSAGQMDGAAVSNQNMPLNFAGDQHMAQLEMQARQEGLQFIEELVFENGAVYKGKFWHADKANGYGVYVHVNGGKYEGYWKNDL